MKKLITTFVATAVALSAAAKIEGDGYYRVQNYKTGRYIYVLDDKGELNFQATTAELGALQLWKNYEKTISDPSTIIYVTALDNKGRTFDLQTQGTGVKTMIDYPVTIYLANSKLGLYSVYGSNSGMVRYIGDATESDSERGYVTSTGNGDYFRWYFHPVTTDESNYFGISPEFNDGASYYTTLYADFPFTCHSDGMNVYYVTSYANGVAYISEIKDTVAKGTPVIIKCSSPLTVGNKLNLGGNGAAVSSNKLKGVYFNNTSLLHKNLTPNDPETMRVLGKLSDGSIGFVKSKEENLPRNKAYLVVPAGSPDEIRMEIANSGISGIIADDNAARIRVDGLDVYVEGASAAEIYTVTGHLVAGGNGGRLSVPAPGIYIVKAGTTVSKIMVR